MTPRYVARLKDARFTRSTRSAEPPHAMPLTDAPHLQYPRDDEPAVGVVLAEHEQLAELPSREEPCMPREDLGTTAIPTLIGLGSSLPCKDDRSARRRGASLPPIT